MAWWYLVPGGGWVEGGGGGGGHHLKEIDQEGGGVWGVNHADIIPKRSLIFAFTGLRIGTQRKPYHYDMCPVYFDPHQFRPVSNQSGQQASVI